MAKKFPIFPKSPERICWGCDKYCREDDLQCGNGCERIQHPIELDGRDWYKTGDWSNLLSDEQQIELGLKTAPRNTAENRQAAYQTAAEKQNGLSENAV